MDATHSNRRPVPRGRKAQHHAGDYSDRLALWTAANLAGMETALLVIREPFLRRVLNKIAGRRRRRVLRVRRPTADQVLPMLAIAIIGSNKLAIHSVFGPPRSAAFKSESKTATISFWESAIWYYPLPRLHFLAMSIIFDDTSAASVEFFRTPSGAAA